MKIRKFGESKVNSPRPEEIELEDATAPSVYPKENYAMYCAAAKTKYTLTQTDINNAFAVVPVLWTRGGTYTGTQNYIINFSVEDTTSAFSPGSAAFHCGEFQNVTKFGFNAVILLANPPASYSTRNTLIVHATAFGLV